jgi:ATP-dependent Clp protease, protease subunit
MKALINFYAAVNEGTINNLLNFITQQIHDATKNPANPLDEIIIQISSTGGSSDHGLLAYNYLRQVNVTKTTIGMGNVDSAAVMIFAAGDRRLAMPSCRFLLHEALTTVTGTFNGTKLHEIANLNERITKDYCKVVSKVTGKTLRMVEKKVKTGQVMSSEDAKHYGLAQELQTEPYVKDLNNLNVLIINNPVQTPPQGQKSTNQIEV